MKAVYESGGDFSPPKGSVISLDDYIKKNQIKIATDNSHLNTVLKQYQASSLHVYFLDVNNDKTKDLMIQNDNGNISNYVTFILYKVNGIYEVKSEIDTNIFPVIYKNKVHFLNYEPNYDTKFNLNILEYKLNGYTIVQNAAYVLKYSYSNASLPKEIKSISDNDFLNGLPQFKIINSGLTNLTSSYNSYILKVTDAYNHSFSFNTKLDFATTSVTPTVWNFTAKDNFTKDYSGINNILTTNNTIYNCKDTDGKEACVYGFKFYKNNKDLYFLKVLYNKNDASVQKSDLILSLYKFNQKSIDMVRRATLKAKISFIQTDINTDP